MSADIEHAKKGDVVEIPVEEFERLESTLELLQDEDLKEAVVRGVRQYENDQSRAWSDVREEL